jgi:hypothetical protein
VSPTTTPSHTYYRTQKLQFPRDASFTKDGTKQTFAISVLGHVLLRYLLIIHLASTAHTVVTSSRAYEPAQETAMRDAKYTSI